MLLILASPVIFTMAGVYAMGVLSSGATIGSKSNPELAVIYVVSLLCVIVGVIASILALFGGTAGRVLGGVALFMFAFLAVIVGLIANYAMFGGDRVEASQKVRLLRFTYLAKPLDRVAARGVSRS